MLPFAVRGGSWGIFAGSLLHVPSSHLLRRLLPAAGRGLLAAFMEQNQKSVKETILFMFHNPRLELRIIGKQKFFFVHVKVIE